jgi:pyruvate-ferredoxin/flavodoxin oxidoreductase
MRVPLTFAEFAMTEGRYRKHFRTAPPETWNDDMVSLAELLDLDPEEREGKYPYIWGVDAKNRLMRALVALELVRSSEERRHFWRQLKGLVGMDRQFDEEGVRNQAKAEMAQRLTASLLAMATGGGTGVLADLAAASRASAPHGGNGAASNGDWEAVWVETPECTACDECILINPKIFAYNDQKQAVIVDPKAGSFKDIVKAAEKCTAGCIHPGTPWDPAEKDLDKLMKRAEKFQ